MYNFLTGPALWATFIIFIGGLLLRIVRLYRLSRKKDQVVYNHASLTWGVLQRLEGQRALAESRRLFYVAATRARTTTPPSTRISNC